MVAAPLAAVREEPVGVGRVSRLGVVRMARARELSAARCENTALRRENAVLRSRVLAGRRGGGARRHPRAVAQSLGFAREAAAKGRPWRCWRFAGVAIDHARRCLSLEARHAERGRAVDALPAMVEREVQRGALRRGIECQ
jgi:hypothetical protein